jgi:hypothetical protein
MPQRRSADYFALAPLRIAVYIDGFYVAIVQDIRQRSSDLWTFSNLVLEKSQVFRSITEFK